MPDPASSATRIARPVWTLDGLAVASKLGHRGCAVQFLGPPVVVDDSLYVMAEMFSLDEFAAEKNNQICLIAIDGSNGEPLWSQGLVLVDEPFFRMQQQGRRNPVGSPTVADGLLICPTDVGLIVGVDLVTGRQRWIYSTRKADAIAQREFFREPLGWEGTPTWPMIHRDRVLLLNRFSDELHCLETTTGKLKFRVPRGDAVYIGAVTEDRIVLVGEREVRTIAMPADGTLTIEPIEPLWSHVVGPVTGRGVRVGEDFLVPLKSGRVASLELASGRDRGFTVTRTFDPTTIRRRPHKDGDDEIDDQELAPWPGNLIACDDVIVSLGLSHLAVYPQARSKLAELRTQPESVERRLLESELAMLLGSEGSPVAELRSMLQEPLPKELRRQAERQLRESLYLELNRDPDQAGELLPQLEKLADTTAEKARLLRRVCEVSLPRDPVRTVRAARDLAALSLDHELELDEHGQHVVSLETWARGYLRQVRARVVSSPAEAEAVDEVLGQERDRLQTTSDLNALRQFARLCDDWPQATGVRFRLAELLIDRSEFPEAELLLVRDRLSSDPSVAAAATVRLLRLWEHVGFYSLAANLLGELEDRFGDIETAEPGGVSPRTIIERPVRGLTPSGSPDVRAKRLTGREFVAVFDRDSMTWAAFARRKRPDWNVRRVVISEDRSRSGELRLMEAFGSGEPRNRALDRAGVGVHLFQTPPLFKPLADVGWRVVDRDSGVVMGQLPELDRFYPTAIQLGSPKSVNHFFPVGGQGRMMGLSLLGRDQDEPAWETPFAPSHATQEFLRVGPVGPGYCVFQSRQHLAVADPATGRIAWRRELEPQSGLLAETDTGLFGDHEALVVFASDQSSFTVYETATGRELRRGRLPVDQHQSRRAFGRKLFHITDANNGPRLRIWDSLTDRNELDEPLVPGAANFQPYVLPDGELLLVLRSGRVRVFDVHNSLVKLDVMLPESDVRGTNTLRAFSDRDRYYVNLQRQLDNSSRMPLSYFVADTLVPKSEVLGDLHAFARPSQPQPLDRAVGPLGEKLWLRVLPQRTFLRLDNARLPFLVAISRQQDRSRADKSALRVEAFEGLTGNRLGACEHVLTTRLVQTQHDAEAARLTLIGLNTRVTLDYGRDKQQLATTFVVLVR
ncbi:MAG: PQQ-binding-like beta-propeller repeat protein [Planctomycetaceae bacterium]